MLRGTIVEIVGFQQCTIGFGDLGSTASNFPDIWKLLNLQRCNDTYTSKIYLYMIKFKWSMGQDSLIYRVQKTVSEKKWQI